MPNVYWSDEARTFLDELPRRVRDVMEERAEYIRRFPDMYPVVQTGRYRGYRRIPIMGKYLVFNRTFGPNGNPFVRAIVRARSDLG